MANTTLNTRILICNDTEANWGTSTKVLLKGEIGILFPTDTTKEPILKVGNGVDTYDKGKWIKFEGKTSNAEEYLKNAQRLSTLVKDTPWCTKEEASVQLSVGDFYVFVDKDDKPHVAVRMYENNIAEVRGIKGGFFGQEMEDGYRDVTISFLENNTDIKNGKEWLEKEEWNKRLIE